MPSYQSCNFLLNLKLLHPLIQLWDGGVSPNILAHSSPLLFLPKLSPLLALQWCEHWWKKR